MAEIRKSAVRVGKTAARLGRDISGMFVSAHNSVQARMEMERARELQRLRNQRIRLEGRARIAELRRREIESIIKARRAIQVRREDIIIRKKRRSGINEYASQWF